MPFHERRGRWSLSGHGDRWRLVGAGLEVGPFQAGDPAQEVRVGVLLCPDPLFQILQPAPAQPSVDRQDDDDQEAEACHSLRSFRSVN
jgi:hypothetical protein